MIKKEHPTIASLWNQTHLLAHRNQVQRVEELVIAA